jgi:uncharacterized protein (TIGR02001 family)
MQGKLEGLRSIVTAVAVAMSVVVGAAAANAADPAQNAGEKESKGNGPDFSVNATYTSDYRFRGFTQTREKPALQGGIDVTWPNFYVGLWASSLDLGQVYNGSGFHDIADLEMIAYAGVKRNIAGFKVDLGALYYFYPGSFGDYNRPVYLGGTIKDLNYFEGMLSISKEIHKDLTLTTTTYYSPDYSGTGQNWAIENMVSRKLGTYRGITPTLSAMIAANFGDNSKGGMDYYYWNAGVSFLFADYFEFDVRWYDTFDVPTGFNSTVTSCRNLCDGRVVARITFEN